MGRVIYLTGAPATGKSSLCEVIKRNYPDLLVLSYSALLREHLHRRDTMTYSTSALREQSSAIITRDDVAAVDKTLIGLVEAERTRRDVIVDSHPVTKESFGFRVTPFTAEQIVALRPNAIVCLYASPDTLRTRIARNADGRPLPTDFELAMHVQTQVSVATQYSVLTGASCYLVDSAEEIPELIERVTPIFKFGSPPAPQSASVQKPVT